MMFVKDWYKSKQIWLGIIATVYSIFKLLGVDLPVDFDEANIGQVFGSVFGLLVIFFRWNTDSVVAQSGKAENIIGLKSKTTTHRL